MRDFDLLVIGGGINGTGIARDAAGRGLAVLLCEQGDLAGGTSSASSKLIHGGLRYLEHGAFRLVRDSLAEREVLLHAAPHLVRPLRFVLPHVPGQRPAWLIRLGLALYDRLARRQTLAGSTALRFAGRPEGRALHYGIRQGFAYSDCWVDDARLVVLNALDAQARGAEIRTRTRFTAAERSGPAWQVELTDAVSGAVEPVAARAVVNAAGPAAGALLHRVFARTPRRPLRLVRGSHLVVPRLYPGAFAYILPNDDGRVVFVLPHEGRFSLIGTTDVDVEAPDDTTVSADEVDYLLRAVNRWFVRPLAESDVIGRFAGVRPLLGGGSGNPAKASRDYALDLDAPRGQAPLLSVLGGKLTTYRRLAERAVDRLARFFPAIGRRWTAAAVLPGGDLPGGDPARLAAEVGGFYPWLPAEIVARYVRLYGTRCRELLYGATGPADLGEWLGGGLTAREVAWLVEREWAESAEDILWRRTKLGLTAPPETARALETWLAGRRAETPVEA